MTPTAQPLSLPQARQANLRHERRAPGGCPTRRMPTATMQRRVIILNGCRTLPPRMPGIPPEWFTVRRHGTERIFQTNAEPATVIAATDR